MAGPGRGNALDHVVVVVFGNRPGYRVPAIMSPWMAEGEVWVSPTAGQAPPTPGSLGPVARYERSVIDRIVEKFVPAQIGEGKYFPHLTVGVAKFTDLKVIEAEPFDAITVHPAGVAVYHLGNNGTARKLLKAWPVTNS